MSGRETQVGGGRHCLPGAMALCKSPTGNRQSRTVGNPPSGLDSPRTYNSQQLAQKLERDRAASN